MPQVDGSQPTNYSAFKALLAAAPAPADSQTDDSAIHAHQQFMALVQQEQIQGHQSSAMQQAEHVRAWITTAFGGLLGAAVFSPQDREYHNQLMGAVHQRMRIVLSLEDDNDLTNQRLWMVPFSEGRIGNLYNLRMNPQGYLQDTYIRIGQGQQWQHHWRWISQPADKTLVVEAVQLAAQMMRCHPLRLGLVMALDVDDERMQQMALVMVRRWLLTVKAMAWLEAALQHDWQDVGVDDLVCFAFNTVKPEWPHRPFAISHRSPDVKPLLEKSPAWRSPIFAIDATYVPAWETNTGMIWGLFASTPNLIKIESPAYDDSVWCRRESELFFYLRDHCDFLPDRTLTVFPHTAMERLEPINTAWQKTRTVFPHSDENRLSDDEKPSPEALSAPAVGDFPPLGMVYAPAAKPLWQLKMLRGAGAMRILHSVLQDHMQVNDLVKRLQSPHAQMPVECITNNPDGWEAYKTIFRELALECGDEKEIPMQFPDFYPQLHPMFVQEILQNIPDLSSGYPALGDIAIAIEWLVTIYPTLADTNMQDMILIDLRGHTKESWMTTPELALVRGISAMAMPPVPLWFIQKAGQHIERWGISEQSPIFTEYQESQFIWMLPGFLGDSWVYHYVTDTDMTLSPALANRCMATKSDD